MRNLLFNRFAHSAGPGMGRSREDGMITWWGDGLMRSSKGQGMKIRVGLRLRFGLRPADVTKTRKHASTEASNHSANDAVWTCFLVWSEPQTVARAAKAEKSTAMTHGHVMHEYNSFFRIWFLLALETGPAHPKVVLQLRGVPRWAVCVPRGPRLVSRWEGGIMMAREGCMWK